MHGCVLRRIYPFNIFINGRARSMRWPLIEYGGA